MACKRRAADVWSTVLGLVSSDYRLVERKINLALRLTSIADQK